MKQTPRPYVGEHDLVRMKHLLVEGKRVSPFSGYIHPGDLDWWNMKTVTVMTRAEEVGNIAFYESAGFKIGNHILRFSKSITR